MVYQDAKFFIQSYKTSTSRIQPGYTAGAKWTCQSERHFAPRSFLSEAEVYTFRTHQFTANGKKVPTELFTRLSQAKD